MKPLALLALAPLLLAVPVATAAEPSRPNILFLFADDWAWPHASCLGMPEIQTPTFDRLAREGVLFRNAHCAAPSCSPSRAAVLTGQWQWRLEEAANLWGNIHPKFAVYPDLLEQAGYFIGLTGKGYGPGSNEGRPHNAAGPAFKDFDAFLAARQPGKPFCFWLGSYYPHRPYPPGSGVKSGKDPAKVKVPPYLPDNATVRSDICDHYLATEMFDRQAAQAVAALEKTGELDNTLIVITGDNGWPFPRSKATCYDTGTHEPLAVWWGGHIKGGRVVDDFVSLADLAPTFLEAAGLTPPPTMTARSFLDILLTDKSGQVDPKRDHVLTGMERHGSHGRDDGEQRGVGYPMRSIITGDFHYIRNFRPTRWPLGDPPAGKSPGFEAFARNTYTGFSDGDAGPSKAWLATHAEASETNFQRAFGKRPACELYDLRNDPFELKNVADDPAYADTAKALDARLMVELKATADPRVTGTGDEFDHYVAANARKSARKTSSPVKPNLVLIMVDDLGYETIGANGGTSYRTPVLDKLAAAGARFTQGYAQPLCTPTRVQLMTGRSNARNYLSFGRMDPQCVTSGNLLKQAGYTTCIAGKWQLGQDVGLPKKFGFDESCLWQHTRRPPRYANPGLEINGVPKDFSNGEYGPDLVNAYALDFIARNKDGPFFLYYPMILTHDPYQPTPDSKDWDPQAKGEQVNRHPDHFGDMVTYMDKLVGKVVAQLDTLGLRDNTLVLFLGDNGTGRGARSMMGDREVIGGKGSTTATGMHVPVIANWPGHVQSGVVCGDLVDTTDFLPTLLDAAGTPPPPGVKLDGRSFLPQLRGQPGQPREWIYSWYSPRQGADRTVHEFTFDQHFKLYRSGKLFNLDRDPAEQHPLDPATLTGDAAAAGKRLRDALEQFNDARPPELDTKRGKVFRPNAKKRNK